MGLLVVKIKSLLFNSNRGGTGHLSIMMWIKVYSKHFHRFEIFKFSNISPKKMFFIKIFGKVKIIKI